MFSRRVHSDLLGCDAVVIWLVGIDISNKPAASIFKVEGPFTVKIGAAGSLKRWYSSITRPNFPKIRDLHFILLVRNKELQENHFTNKFRNISFGN